MAGIEQRGVSAISDAIMARVLADRGELIHPTKPYLRGRATTSYFDHLVRDARKLAEIRHADSWRHPTRRGTRSKYDADEQLHIVEQLQLLARGTNPQAQAMVEAGITMEALEGVRNELLSEPH